MRLSFREQPIFSKVRDQIFGDDTHFAEFQWRLIENPEAGSRIPGAGQSRKVRFRDASRGKGTRGGLRVIYAYYPNFATILLLFAYNKNISDITPAQKILFAEICREFAEELPEETL